MNEGFLLCTILGGITLLLHLLLGRDESGAKRRQNSRSPKGSEHKKARYFAEVEKEKAYTQQAGPLARAEKVREVVAAEQDVERIRREKEAEVQAPKPKQRKKVGSRDD